MFIFDDPSVQGIACNSIHIHLKVLENVWFLPVKTFSFLTRIDVSTASSCLQKVVTKKKLLNQQVTRVDTLRYLRYVQGKIP